MKKQSLLRRNDSTDDDFQKQMTQVRRLKNADPSIFELKNI